MPIAKGQTGFQPPAREAERRAFFDLLRRIKALEDATPGGGGGGEPLLGDHLADLNDAHNASAVSFIPTGTISATNVQDAIVEAVAEAGGGGGGPDEVFIGPSDPGGTYELWVDSDATTPASVTSYVHTQGTPADTWVINHNLAMFPNVVVEDSGGTTVEGEIVYDSANQVTLTFSAAFSGTAYLS